MPASTLAPHRSAAFTMMMLCIAGLLMPMELASAHRTAAVVMSRASSTVPHTHVSDVAFTSRRRLDDEDGDGYTNDEDDSNDEPEDVGGQNEAEEQGEGYARDGWAEGSDKHQNIIDENEDFGRDPGLLKCV